MFHFICTWKRSSQWHVACLLLLGLLPVCGEPRIAAGDEVPGSSRGRSNASRPVEIAASSRVERIEPWEEHESRLRERLLAIAGEYARYGRVDDESRWAPELCRMPLPSRARFSTAEGRETQGRPGHSQKLYFLFARDRAGYVNLGRPAGSQVRPRFQPDSKGNDQVVVKESWLSEEVTSGALPGAVTTSSTPGARYDGPRQGQLFGGSYYPYVKKEGKTYCASKKAGLFIMLQAGALATEGRAGEKQAEVYPAAETDGGWLYGTVTADGKTVTAAGKMASCMECHQHAKHGRLFGLGTVKGASAR